MLNSWGGFGRFAASYGCLRSPQQFFAPKVLTRPLRGLVRGPSAPSTIFCAKGTRSAASRPRTGAFGPLNNFLRQRYSLGRFAASHGGLRPPQQFFAPKVLTRPLRGLARGPSVPSTIFCAKGTHSAASRPRTGALGPLNNFLRQRYSLGRFAASYGGLRPPQQFFAPKVLARPLRGLARGPSAPSTIFCANPPSFHHWIQFSGTPKAFQSSSSIPITGTQSTSIPITGTKPTTFQSPELNPPAFQSLGLNPPHSNHWD
ncbi:hypothetical protein niasHS_015659 [Heterodera schachtii]|uniref:Uncharacterized protein n=1 Tax=Heterodera schachtii TaxID=97005 RepID=A0ABD2I6V7_HETSC